LPGGFFNFRRFYWFMADIETIDCAVVGAGIVGLAVARALALAGREVVVLEAADAIGTETSSRNSEVIHAGIYYPTGSLKAKHCVEGKKFIYGYCAERGIRAWNCGKLIVASSKEQVAYLEKLKKQGEANDVDDLEMIDGDAARKIEPLLSCYAALRSPSTGVVDSHSLMLAFQGDAEANGAMIAFETPVLGGHVANDGIVLETGGAAPMRIKASLVVNAAGLGANKLGRAITGVPPDSVPPLHYAKGNYFALQGKSPFSRLIYPVPEQGGLGVHITVDLAGQARFGPDVEWIDKIDYDVDATRCEGFYAEVRKYWPGLPDGALVPAYSGIRPKIVPAGAPNPDFVIQGPETHGVPGLIALYGIESPGLTSSPSIAAEVARLAAAIR
jgi:L-2-hydroxyglutarate oxidase LhgO